MSDFPNTSTQALRSNRSRMAVIVLGMHRSGSSALSGLVHRLGAAAPAHLMEPNSFNPLGYWESLALMNFNDRLLESVGSNWKDWGRVDPERLDPTWEEELATLIESEFADAPLLVLKDPRFCRIAPLLLSALSRLDISPRIVFSVRNPLESAQSLFERDRIEKNEALLLWLRSVLDSEYATRQYPRCFVSFEDLLSDWRNVAARMALKLGLVWPERSPELDREIDDFVVDNLRHHRVPDHELDELRLDLPWVPAVYETLRDLARGCEADAPRIGRLDQIRCAFDDAAPLIRSLLHTKSQLLHDLTTAQREAERSEQLAHSAIAQREAEHSEQLAQISSQLSSTKGALLEREVEIIRCADELSTTKKLLASQSFGVAGLRRHFRGVSRSWSDLIRRQVKSQLARNATRDSLRTLPLKTVAGFIPAAGRRLRRYERRRAFESAYLAIKYSGLFDAEYYLATYPDVREKKRNPIRHYLLRGAAEGRDPSATFSTSRYLADNPDVDAARVNPLLHYILHGCWEGRLPGSFFSNDHSPIVVQSNQEVIFISGEPNTPGHNYRVRRYADALSAGGYAVREIHASELANAVEVVQGASAMVLWRLPWSEFVGRAITACRMRGTKVIFDLDDYMFDSSIAKPEIIDGIRSQNIPVAAVQGHYELVSRAVAAADFVTCATKSLATGMRRRFSKPTFVLPNGFDEAWLETSRQALLNRMASGAVRIGYAAGTLTHQRDFAVAAPALLQILRENPACSLTIFQGTLDLSEFPELMALSRQIEIRSQVPHSDLPLELARFDINIAPLEVGNIFCEAKSELKYFEAALVEVPTIASATAPMRGAIRHGITGFVAHSEHEWLEYLRMLVRDSELRARMAHNAYNDVLWRFGPERRMRLAVAAYKQMLDAAHSAASYAQLSFQLGEESETLPEVPVFKLVFESERRDTGDVAVIVPLYNYAHYVLEALQSVAAQTLPGIDLVVIDDCSTDDSLEVALRWLKSNCRRFNHVALLQHQENCGLGPARNTGFWFSRAPFVLPLDADNMLLPACLEQCLRGIRTSGAAMAYPILQQFGDAGGKMGMREWMPAQFANGNYIDAMALIRKSAWQAVGGYQAMRPNGWEDFDFWCRFVEKGFWGVRVPEVLARYRVHGQSMLRTETHASGKHDRLLAEMKSRHSWLDLTEIDDVMNQDIDYGPGFEAQTPPVADASTVDINPPSASRAELRAEPRPHNRERIEELCKILHCPLTKEPLRLSADGSLVSRQSGRVWPITQGRPVFMDSAEEIRSYPDHLSNPLPPQALDLIRGASGLVLNLSAGGTRHWLPNVVELEAAIFRNTDIVGDAHSMPFADESFEVVISLNAFEHYHSPERVVAEIGRILKPNGTVFVHTAFLQPLHEAPYHFYNSTSHGIKNWFRHFKTVDLSVSENFNPVYGLSWLASEIETVADRSLEKTLADAIMKAPLRQYSKYWRDSRSRSDEAWDGFLRLPQDAQEGIAAGFEYIGRKQ